MKEYVVKFFQEAYKIINPNYARDKRIARFKELENNGELEKMCTSEIHELFGIKKYSHEI